MDRLSRALAHLSWWLRYHAAKPAERSNTCREPRAPAVAAAPGTVPEMPVSQ